MNSCLCGSSKTYDKCCGRFISQLKQAGTPEELMRSRYTAYTQANVEYIARTMKSPASDDFDPLDAKQWAEKVTWLKLKIIKSSANEKKGIVEFRVHFIESGKKHTMHELSEFVFEDGQWFYVKGKVF